jgi:hypothetical protein
MMLTMFRQWSAQMRSVILPIAAAVPLASFADSVVVFNEIHYHPVGGTGEWIELRNQLAVDIDVSGWSLADGVSFTFPKGTIIPAGGYLVIAESPEVVAGALGPWSGKLDNAGETIELRNNNGRLMDSLTYGNQGDWPLVANGLGFTLAKAAASRPSGQSTSWAASLRAGGTPGEENFVPLPPIETICVPADASWKLLADGRDPGVGWTGLDFDDSHWSEESAAIFQLGNDPLPSPHSLGTALPPGPVTYYFRTHFSFYGDPATTSLRLRLLLDDGAAVYLNGEELLRVNLPDEADPMTLAAVPRRGEPHFQEFDVPAGRLLAGKNLLAVELHQADVLAAHPAAVLAARPTAYWRFGETTNPVGDLADVPATPELGPQNGRFVGLAAADLAAAGPRPTDTIGGKPLLGFEAGNTAPRFRGNNHGGDDVVLFPDDGALNPAPRGSFSFSAWVKGSPDQVDGAAIIAKGTGGGGEQFACDVYDKRFRFFAWNNSSPNSPFGAHSNVQPNGSWQHLVGVCNLAQGIFRLYLNGEPVASTSPSSTIVQSNHPISIGSRTDGPTSPYNLNFNGTIDEVAIFPRALSSAQVQALYQSAFAESAVGPDLEDAVFALELSTLEQPVAGRSAGLVLNEIAGAGSQFGVELINAGPNPVALGGTTLSRFDRNGRRFDFPMPDQSLPSGEILALDVATLGWFTSVGDRLVLTSVHSEVLDAEVVKSNPRARFPGGSGQWLNTETDTPGLPNSDPRRHGIVINEIMYHPPSPPLPDSAVPGQWIEIHNTSNHSQDLGGWRVSGGISYEFPGGTIIEAGGFLVVARSPANLMEVAALGPWSGSLSKAGDTILLEDAAGNPADRVAYFDRGNWPEYADGGGSSLELRDPRADRNSSANWAASDESSHSAWQTLTWRGPANPAIAGEPDHWRELNLCLLDGAGEVLIDDVSVIDTVTGQQLIQNGTFSSGMDHWRATGTHRLASIIPEPGNPSNPVLHVVATGPGEYQGNQIESTFRNNQALVTGREYIISLRARWLAGAAKLNTRLYFNRLARTHTLDVRARGGTPGRRNSRAVENLGPTLSKPAHHPVVPAPNEPVTVSIEAADPDGVHSLILHYAPDSGEWRTVPMESDDEYLYVAEIPGFPQATTVQFFITATDTREAISTYPRGGADSRALYRVEDGQAKIGPQSKFRLLMTAPDAAQMHDRVNVLSNANYGATIIADENTAYYDVGVRLKGSYVGRDVPRVGFSVEFQPDQPFRGFHRSVAVDRSQHVAVAQGEILVKHMASAAGGIPNMYDDLARFVHVIPDYNSSAQLRLTGFGRDYRRSSFPNGNDGQMYEYEVLRWTTNTSDGSSEGIKLPGSGYTNPDLQDQGDDKEAYRWSWLLGNNEAEDNFAPAMAVAKLFSLNGNAFNVEASRRLDVDQWLRAMAFQSLVGPNDVIYTGSNVHNIRFFSRPDDGRMLYLPWDWDSAFSRATNAPLIGGGNVANLVTSSPTNRRIYLNHIHDLVANVFNGTYMSRWTGHYGEVAGENYTSILNYINARAAFALDALPTTVPFEAVAGNVDASGRVTITGQSNIAVATIAVNGITYTPTWQSDTRWQISVSVPGGTSQLEIRGLDRNGSKVSGAAGSAIVENPNPAGWPTIRINEWLALNTTIPEPESGRMEDWIELYNPGAAAVDLSNWGLSDKPGNPRLTVIPQGTMIPAGSYLLIWADGSTPRVSAAGHLYANFALSGSGESIVLSAPDGQVVARVDFNAQTSNISEGHYSAAGEKPFRLSAPTPNGPNVLLNSLGATFENDSINFRFTTTPGHLYRIEVSGNLQEWLILTDELVATDATHTFTTEVRETHNFYRAVLIR